MLYKNKIIADMKPTEVQKYLGGVDYPCSKQDLVDKANNSGAPEGVMDYLKGLPEKDYQTPAEVMKEFG